MKVNVLAFGVAREITSGSVVQVEAHDGLTVEQLKQELEQRHPRLKDLRSLAVAVNGVYAQPGQTINAGDEVALIPPVSGG